MHSIAWLVAVSSVAAPRGPLFSWDRLPTFFHGSNASGPVNADALALMARFPLVTVEKFQGPCGWRPDASPSCDQEAQIIDVLKGVKAINPNVSTIFCTRTSSAQGCCFSCHRLAHCGRTRQHPPCHLFCRLQLGV